MTKFEYKVSLTYREDDDHGPEMMQSIFLDDNGDELAPEWVNVYLEDRMYGGPEEGGWWYDAGILVRSSPYLGPSTLDAERAWCGEENACRRSDTGSVLSEGRYLALAEPGIGRNYPAVRPHYE